MRNDQDCSQGTSTEEPVTIENLEASPGQSIARDFPYKEEIGGSSPLTPTTESLATAGLS